MGIGADRRSPPVRGGLRVLRPFVFFAATVLVVDAVVGEKGLVALLKARQQYHIIEASLTRARADNVRLREEAYRLREDSRTIEAIARRELGLIRPGEKLFIVKDVPGETAGPR